MPELPEVEIFRRYLADNVLGREIVAIDANDDFVRRAVTERSLRDALGRRRFAKTHRHGKWAFLALEPEPSPWLVLHFGMTGAPVAIDAETPLPRFPRFVVHFEDGGAFVLDDARRLGGVGLTQSPAEWVRAHRLGPDALESPPDDLADALSRRRGRLKPLLLDQTVLAGVGNVYADEILYRAGLHPLRRVDELDAAALERLAVAVHGVLSVAVDLGALFHLMPEDWLVRHRKEGASCPSGCAGRLERIVVGGRSTYFCPTCQPL